MPTSLANYAEDRITNAICTNVSFAVAALYIQLHTADPGEDCTLAVASNTTRKLVTFGASSAGIALNTNLVEWLNVPTTEVYHDASLWDAATAGNPIIYGPLSVPKSVTAGDTFDFAIGDISVTLS